MKKEIIALLNKLPYIRGLHRQLIRHENRTKEYEKRAYFPIGHYYSPVVSIEDLKLREDEIWNRANKETLQGINLNIEGQLILLMQLSLYYPELPFNSEKQVKTRYYFDNGYYTYTDGIVLYAMMRYLSPNKIIEVGSGFSSALMLDVNTIFFNNDIQLTFIEPNPERLYSLISENDKQGVSVHEQPVQEVQLNIFKQLKKGDILFIDSSHVSKTGSDVNFILFDVLPVLESGVFVHFHDVFYPFEYPKEWVLKGISWNESYLLRSFLMYNNSFEIKLFSHFIHQQHSSAFSKMPLSYNNTGGNLWIEKK